MILEQSGHPLYGADNLPNPWTNSQITRVQAGYNPVLVADRDYWMPTKTSDTAGNWPANVPVMRPNQTVTRTLDVYNDTFSGTAVDVFWELRQDSATGATLASGQIHPTIALDMFIQIQSVFDFPMLRMEHSATWFYIRKNPAWKCSGKRRSDS